MANHRQDPKHHDIKSPEDDGLSGKAQHVFEQSRDSAREAAKRAAGEIEANPIGVVVGGVALGALVASLIPRSQREKEMLAPVGRRLAETATAAVAAAKESGRSEMEARGLTREGARDQIKSLLDSLGKAATSAGSAAADAARGRAKEAADEARQTASDGR